NLGSAEEHGGLGVDDQGLGPRAGIERAAKQGLGQKRRSLRGRKIQRAKARVASQDRRNPTVLQEAGSPAEVFRRFSLTFRGFGTEAPAQAGGVSEVEPLRIDETLDDKQHCKRADCTPRNRASLRFAHEKSLLLSRSSIEGSHLGRT